MTSRYRNSLCRTIESATSGMNKKLHRTDLRAKYKSGSSVGAHQRWRFNKYQSGDWYFTRDAKSGSTSVSRANFATDENGLPQVIQSYMPTAIVMDTIAPRISVAAGFSPAIGVPLSGTAATQMI